MVTTAESNGKVRNRFERTRLLIVGGASGTSGCNIYAR